MPQIRFIIRYLKYLLHAQTRHGVHSPFVYSLFSDAIRIDQKKYYAYDKIEYLRSLLLKNNAEIQITDLGAGSKINPARKRKIADIAKYSAKPPKMAQLLFRLVLYLKPKNIIELGTSLGISTAYLSSPLNHTKVYTLEGCPETAAIALQNFKKLDLQNIELTLGNFDKTFPEILKNAETLDLVFIDGNHTKEATLRYFYQCLDKVHNDSFIIFDDIHWSKDMEEAWTSICANEKVCVSVDLFFMGIVFFRKQQVKEHFILKF